MKLIEPTPIHAEEIRSYRQDFLASGEHMDGTGSLHRVEDPLTYLQICADFKQPALVPPELVPATQFVYVDEQNHVVGMLQVRHCLNDYLRRVAGHIGYSVRPSERRKGYAKAMLHDALDYCRQLGLTRVMVSCNDNNEASRRTILANGGVYDGTVEDDNARVERYWITL